MAIIFMNLRGSLTSGGPTVAAARLANGFIKRGHKVVYDNPSNAKAALCIIESGKVLQNIKNGHTKVIVRIDGAYFKRYWHGKTPDRKWRPDMDALHKAIKRDVKNVDMMVYQSAFSKKMIDNEIAKRTENFVVINNGIDTDRFRPKQYKKDDTIRLFHHGVIRNDYIITGLIEIYEELKARGHKVEITIVGSMNAECSKIFAQYKNNKDIIYKGQVKNSLLHTFFVGGAIGVYNRQGSSNDNCVIESLSSGCPVVIPSFGGNAELVINGKSGIVVDSNNWDYGIEYSKRMVDGVEKIFDNLDQFVYEARQHATTELSIEKMVDKYIKAMGI